MKVLITSDGYKPMVNGVVTSILNLKAGLENKGAEVRILTLSSNNDSYYEEGVYYLGSADLSKLYPGARLQTKSGRSEMKDILDWKPDVVHSQNEFGTHVIAKKIASKLKIPLVHTYHTVYEDYTHYFSPSKRLGKGAVSKATKMLSSKLDTIIAPTSKTANILEKYSVDCPIEIIPSGISLEKYYEHPYLFELDEIKRKLHIKEDSKVLVTVSRVSKEKNILELIEAVEHLRDKDYTLVVVGDGPIRHMLELMVEQKNMTDIVKFTGMINPNDIPNYYKMADVFVSASTSETQGLTYIEALASSTPIICRQDECLNGVLEEGINGFSYESPQDLVQKIEMYFSEVNKDTMSVNAKASSTKFSREVFSDKVHKLYHQLIKKNSEEQLILEKEKVDSRLLNLFTGVVMILLTLLTVYGYQKGYFTSIDELQKLVATVGLWGPVVFMLSQILQVVFPIIPGGLGCLAGVILFGPFWGFVYNYVGIVAGSLIVFGLAKIYGYSLITRLFPKKLTDKYYKWVEQKEKFKKWFAVAIFLPIAPDDFLCYLAGTTKMKWSDYTAIIVFGKPLSIAAYSLGLVTVFQQMFSISI